MRYALVEFHAAVLLQRSAVVWRCGAADVSVRQSAHVYKVCGSRHQECAVVAARRWVKVGERLGERLDRAGRDHISVTVRCLTLYVWGIVWLGGRGEQESACACEMENWRHVIGKWRAGAMS